MEVWRDLRHEQTPCFLDQNGHSQPGAAHCAHLRRPTPEEIAAYEQVLKQLNEKIRIAIDGVADWREAHKGQSASKVVNALYAKADCISALSTMAMSRVVARMRDALGGMQTDTRRCRVSQ
jgi:hypothetical protein